MKYKILALALVLAITASFTACGKKTDSTAAKSETAKITETVTESETTTAETTTVKAIEKETSKVTENTAATEQTYKYGHVNVPSDWTYSEDEYAGTYTSPDKKTTAYLTIISDISTNLTQTAASFVDVMGKNGNIDGYSIYNANFAAYGKSIQTVAGIKKDDLENKPYDGTFIYVAFADEENHCVRIVHISSEEIYDIKSNEFKQLDEIFLSYSLK